MLRSPGWREVSERAEASSAPAPRRGPARRATSRPDPQETLALVEGAGAAFEMLQLQLLSVLQKAKTSLQDVQEEKAQLQVDIEALAREKDDWSQRAQKAEATLDRANQVLQTQQSVLEKALLREREAVQRAYMLELRLRQTGHVGRPG
jgi:peptidoglycan hydrolase CwlO-like protein